MKSSFQEFPPTVSQRIGEVVAQHGEFDPLVPQTKQLFHEIYNFKLLIIEEESYPRVPKLISHETKKSTATDCKCNQTDHLQSI